nr:PREDICTED: uncharacterized protein LOC109643288 isoform X3 [Paralichthys olivaceus]
MKAPGKSRAEFLFDQIRSSTPTYDSGVLVNEEPQVSQEQEFAGSSSPLQQEVFGRERKRVAADSGYLSDQTEGPTAHKRRVESQTGGGEPNSAVTASCSDVSCSQGGWRTIQNQVLLSLRESQQQVSSLLTAVHQHRLLLLQKFENDVTDQLKQLEENSTTVNNMNTQILSFFQDEMQRLGSFCDEHQQRLKCLENGEAENASIQ